MFTRAQWTQADRRGQALFSHLSFSFHALCCFPQFLIALWSVFSSLPPLMSSFLFLSTSDLCSSCKGDPCFHLRELDNYEKARSEKQSGQGLGARFTFQRCQHSLECCWTMVGKSLQLWLLQSQQRFTRISSTFQKTHTPSKNMIFFSNLVLNATISEKGSLTLWSVWYHSQIQHYPPAHFTVSVLVLLW